MALKLGLTLYSLGQKREAGQEALLPPRPKGRLVWGHAPSAAAARGLLQLANRLIDEDGVSLVITCPDDLPLIDGVIHQAPPGDTPASARAFFDHWKPELAIFTGGELRPASISEGRARGLPFLMADVRKPSLPKDREGWFPGLIKGALAEFSFIGALDDSAARELRRAGAPPEILFTTGRLEEPSAAHPCNEGERSAFAQSFASRPVWFAASLPEAEEDAVFTAHRVALGQTHRLLLIVVPENPDRIAALSARAESEGWATAQRALEQEPAPDTEVFLVDQPSEIGLWYRLAPITFLGGSLSGTGALRDPMEAAALGSAIIHGPRAGSFGPTLGRLGAARAARAVSSSRDLSEALGDLLSPDRAARLAQSAWSVASEGVEVTDALLDRIRRLLDRGG
jgi:3-deoxy-D-manno-octulosonic-acid transferase